MGDTMGSYVGGASQFLNVITKGTPLAYLVVDSDTEQVLSFNEQFCRLWHIGQFGDEPANRIQYSLVLARMLMLIPHELQPQAVSALNLMKGQDEAATDMVLTTGQTIRCLAKRICHDHHFVQLYLYEDITRKTLETEDSGNCRGQLAQVWEKYQLLKENTKDIILFTRFDGRIVEANTAAEKAYGYCREQLLQMNVDQLRKSGRAMTRDELLHLEIQGAVFDNVHHRKDGTVFYVQENIQGVIVQGERLILNMIRDISERKNLEKQLIHMARHDYLTRIPNRHYLEEFLADSIHKSNTMSALLIIDLDNFKAVNDSYGHAAGDQLLIQVVDSLQGNLRQNDFLSRIGGDEFAVYLPDTNLEGAQIFANQLLSSLARRGFFVKGSATPFRVTASIGVTMIDRTTEMTRLFSYADAALYAAKEGGKNRVFIIENDEDKIKISENYRILTLINDALREDRFKLYLQPIYKNGGHTVHYEALLRMYDHAGRILKPSIFIPIAERYGFMPMIDRWVVKNTLGMLAANKHITIFVNLSGDSLGETSLLEWIVRSIELGGIDATRLGFEITETTAIKDLAKADQWIRRLKVFGCRFALDDFGVGFSSFSHLHMLPVDFLKIDGSFVRNLDSDPTKCALVEAMNAVAHKLGKKTIAEFVENETIWSILSEMKVDCGQGYYLGKPAPAEQIMAGITGSP